MSVLYLLVAPKIWGQVASLTIERPDCQCEQALQDPQEFPQAFGFGKFQGQCIDTCRFRPASILYSKKFDGNESKTLIGNILHLEHFYQGAIRPSDIQNVEVGFEEFLPSIFHVFLKFNLKESSPSIELVQQAGGKPKTIKVRSLVVSSEGVPPKGHKYNILESYFGHYLLIHRLVTGDEIQRWTAQLKHPVKMFPLQLPEGAAARIFTKAVLESDRIKFQNVYQLFENNCSTSALGFIDSEVNSGVVSNFWLKFEEALPITGPIGTLRALVRRKLVDQQTL